jgi:hypothetical protein
VIPGLAAGKVGPNEMAINAQTCGKEQVGDKKSFYLCQIIGEMK